EAVARVEQVPLTLGTWKGKTLESDPDSFAQAGALGYWTRTYRDGPRACTVILMCGPSGPMSVHTPDVCYLAAGYEMAGTPAHLSVPADGDQPAADFLTASFRRQGAASTTSLRIYWSWRTGGPWQAPDSPRLTFRGAP